MTEAVRPRIAGGGYAFQTVRPASPMLRIRYRSGVAVDPHGFPDWLPYARAVVELPPVDGGHGVDEARVLDVLTANETLAGAGDPLFPRDHDSAGAAAPIPAGAAATPAGWAWAHLALTRRVALVPAELHGSFRHLGGVSTGTADRSRRGLPVDGGSPPPLRFSERLADPAVRAVEQRLGVRLPPAYRDFLLRTNGGSPARPAVHPAFGFLLDQPLFGTARPDWLWDLAYANAWFGDRLTADWLAIGYVQGGLLAVKVRSTDIDSVWYFDDDDPRATDADSAAEVCGRLLHRCADDFATFWRALREPPTGLRERARAGAAAGRATLVGDERLGSALPPARRAPGRPA